jgi:hypothetical protein
MKELEQELQQALERQPAPAGLKHKIMERRRPAQWRIGYALAWQRMAASLALAATLAGAAGWVWHEREERRRGEAARQQVLTALRITGHALNHVSNQLAAHGRADRE